MKFPLYQHHHLLGTNIQGVASVIANQLTIGVNAKEIVFFIHKNRIKNTTDRPYHF